MIQRFDYSGYPTRNALPSGYCFIQYVQIFRSTGGYGSLKPIIPASTQGSVKDGGVTKGARALTTAPALTEKPHMPGQYDAIEGDAEAEAKSREISNS